MADNRYLLDTHTLAWFQENNPQIPARIMSIIQDPQNTIIFSQISLLEISIKQKIGKLPNLYASTEDIFSQAIKDRFTFLTIQNAHIYTYSNIPLFEDHRDPFDRLLIATALNEKADVLSADKKLKLYADLVKVIW